MSTPMETDQKLPKTGKESTAEAETKEEGDEGEGTITIFEENDDVLCFHGPVLYEAKVCDNLHNLLVAAPFA